MISNRIRQARLACGLNISELAEHAGLSQDLIEKWENGALTPDSSELIKLSRACGVKVAYFLHPRSELTLDDWEAAIMRGEIALACQKNCKKKVKRARIIGVIFGALSTLCVMTLANIFK
jgi:transcriptional regulator with XRE-family HTH domain